MIRTMVVDWRGVPDTKKRADFYSIASTAEARPLLGNPSGRVLAALSTTVLFNGEFPSSRPFNADLCAHAMKRSALTGRVVWGDPLAWHTRLIDITKRGMAGDMLGLIWKYFPWADGIHLDYFTAMSWAFPELAPLDDLWDRVLAGLANGIRDQGKLCLGQQFHPTAPSTALSGEFWEVSPTSFGQTLESHAADVKAFRDLVRRVDQRETLFVSEIREPARFPQSYLDQVNAWAEANDFVLSICRDATARGAA